MRTTIDLPDEIVKKAKMKAIEQGVSLKTIFLSALEKELENSIPSKNDVAPWKKLKGKGSSEGLSSTDSGFYGYSGPDWNYIGMVNDSGE